MSPQGTVLVVGGTGLLGREAARRVLSEGFSVRLLVRNAARARQWLQSNGLAAEVVEGAVEDVDAVDRAVRGCRFVHISLAATGSDLAELERVEHLGTVAVAQAARRHGVELLSYVSGSLVHVDYGPKLPEHAAKLGAEAAIGASGVPHVIFRPTYVTDNLPRHIRGHRAVVIGRPTPLHMVTAADLAQMVARSYQLPGIAGSDFYVFGPEPITTKEALRIYCSMVAPDRRVIAVPRLVMAGVDRGFMHGQLKNALQLIALLNRLGEQGDPTEANQRLGAPTTTVREWCTSQSLAHPAGL